jgi:uncharacterized protein
MHPSMTVALVLLFAALSFMLSASAGMGGSLILVPTLGLLLGTKEGIALAAILLALNNVAKIIAYRRTIPFRAALGVVVMVVIGSAVGARLMVAAPVELVQVAVIFSLVAAFLLERSKPVRLGRTGSMGAALGAGLTSGFSGTSGPLKGISLRMLSLDRLHFVGAASIVSLAGDVTKTAVFAEASLLNTGTLLIVSLAIPLMPLATYFGWRLNNQIGERAFSALFWTVMAGYSARLLLSLR